MAPPPLPIIHSPNGASTPTNGMNGHRPKVLVPEKVSPDGLALLKKTLDVDEKKGLSPDELKNIIGEYEALIVRSETKVNEDLLKAGKNLKVVARAGVGVDNVDVTTATNLGIIVVNSPAGNIGAAAEHTIALLMAVARNIGDACSGMKTGKWERGRLVGVEVKSKTLGIIGLGKVGLTVARLAVGLGMRVEALDPYASASIAQSAQVTMVSSLPELLENCDFLTIHTPLIASTKGMIGAQELNSMKKGARVLNVARGGMFDEESLLAALESGQIGGAGIDVFTSEPPQPDSPAAKLIAHPKCTATPHLGASTVEAQENVSIDVCEQVISILGGDLPRSAVNAPLILPEDFKTLQPFVRLVEKMGSLYTQHYSARARSESEDVTFDLIYEGALAELRNTKPLFASLIKGLVAPISSENVNIVNADLVAKSRGIIVNEQHSRGKPDHSFSSLVTLRAKPASASRSTSPYSSRGAPQLSRVKSFPPAPDRSICGYVSGPQIFISRLDRFATAFAPEGNLLICHNYDNPGMIGKVGQLLGAQEVNINFMTVAPITDIDDDEGPGGGVQAGQKNNPSKEALMILGVDKEATKDVIDKLMAEKGILDVSAVSL